MGRISDEFEQAFRNYAIDGVPASGPNEPDKAEVRAIGQAIEAAMANLTIGSASVTKATRDDLNADLAWPANAIGLVYADATDANNDLYVKVGASGTGSWTLTSVMHTAIEGLAQGYVDAAEGAAEIAVAAAGNTFLAALRVLVMGDSVIEANHNTQGASTNQYGEFFWAQAMFPYFNFDVWRDDSVGTRDFQGLNQGFAGENSADMLTHLAAAEQMAPDVICIAIGVNDLGQGVLPSVTAANIETAIKFWRARGKPILLGNVRPVGDNYGGDANWNYPAGTYQTRRITLNGLIEDLAEQYEGVTLVDLATAYGGDVPVAGDLRDKLHPKTQGAIKGSQPWIAGLKAHIKPLPANKPAYIESTNLVTNGTFTGTAGTKASTVTGTVGSSWFYYGGSATTSIVGSKPSDGGQAFAIDPGAGSGTETLVIQPGNGDTTPNLGVPVGTTLRVVSVIEIDDWAGWRKFNVQMFAGRGTAANTDPDALVNLDFDGARTFTFISPPAETYDATPTPSIRISYDGAASGVGHITIRSIWIGIEQDPRPLFNFAPL